MPRLLVILVLLLPVLALAACGGDGDGDDAPSAATTTGTATAPPTEPAAGNRGCERGEPQTKPDVALDAPTGKLDTSKTHVLVLDTTCGTIEITLDAKGSPKTARSLAYLAEEGFYDGLTFHRIADQASRQDFVIQGGDPLGDGTGGPGYSVVEAPPADAEYTRGVVAMAKTGQEEAGTSGSQFYIVTADDAGLPPEYALAGKVTKGDDVVSRIARVEADPSSEQPLEPVVIKKATVETR